MLQECLGFEVAGGSESGHGAPGALGAGRENISGKHQKQDDLRKSAWAQCMRVLWWLQDGVLHALCTLRRIFLVIWLYVHLLESFHSFIFDYL